MKLVNLTRKTIVSCNLRIADSFFSRLKGLLGTVGLPDGDALLLRPCNNIHMFGMKYAIDVAFVDDQGKVLKNRSGVGARAFCRLSGRPFRGGNAQRDSVQDGNRHRRSAGAGGGLSKPAFYRTYAAFFRHPRVFRRRMLVFFFAQPVSPLTISWVGAKQAVARSKFDY